MKANKTTKWSAVVILIGLITAVAFFPQIAQSEEPAAIGYATDQIVVKLSSTGTLDNVNATYGTVTVKPLLNSGGIYLLQAPDDVNPETLTQAMAQDPQIAYAELNFIGSAPEAHGSEIYGWGSEIYGWGSEIYGWNDDGSSSTSLQESYEWELGGDDISHYLNQTALQNVDAYNAWSVSYGAGVIIAVLDTGVDLTHPVLVSDLIPGYDFVDDDDVPYDTLNGIDDDGDGYIDEVAGHGTHVAGILHLLAPEAQIMPLRVLDTDGQGDSFVVAEAILYAVEHGADIINLSLGTISQSQFLTDVINQAAANGVLVVGAAGNLDMDIQQFPAASTCAIGVTAVTSGNKKTDYASYGNWVTVSGPGQRVYSTFPGGQFAWWKGTSMAAPFVSGQAALLLGYDPALTIEELGLLIAGTTEITRDHSYNGKMGTGRVNLGASMAYRYYNVWPEWLESPLAGCG